MPDPDVSRRSELLRRFSGVKNSQAEFCFSGGSRAPRFRDTLSRVPELPDITVYLEALERRVLGQTLNNVQVASPFLFRTAIPV